VKEIASHHPIYLGELNEYGVPALVSAGGPSLHSFKLSLCGATGRDPALVAGDVPVIDFSKLVNLRHLRFQVVPGYTPKEDDFRNIITWIIDRLTELSKASTTLCNFTLQLELGTRSPPEDSAAHHRSYVQHCKLLDDTLSSPLFVGPKEFVLEIHTFRLNASDEMELQRLAPTRFPKSAARGIFRVIVVDDVRDYFGFARKRDEDGYTNMDLELP